MNTPFLHVLASQPASRREFLGGSFALAAAATALADGVGRAARASETRSSEIVELRQYTLHPGQRDVLIELFDREFLESQEAVGARVIAEFRDLDRPDRFVWLRGFPDMETRKYALTEFYSGPVWQKHRAAANATMIDSDNVLLLKPARAGSGFQNEAAARPAPGASAVSASVATASIWYFSDTVAAAALDRFAREAVLSLEREGAPAIAWFTTESAENNFPALPVRESENVIVWFSVYPDEAAERAIAARLDASADWNRVLDSFARDFSRAPELLRLSPTARSRPLA